MFIRINSKLTINIDQIVSIDTLNNLFNMTGGIVVRCSKQDIEMIQAAYVVLKADNVDKADNADKD